MEEISFIDVNEIKQLSKIIKPKLEEFFLKDEKIAIKLHMGEDGNKYYLKPKFVKIFVALLKDIGAKPFLFDSPTIYPGCRDTVEKYYKTAAKHGFTEEIGCPIVISNDFEYVKTEHLNVEVCTPLAEADGTLVLSHVKGHACSGFGAAIKNLGMGGLTKKSKTDIHEGGMPVFAGECKGCGNCAKLCFNSAVKIKEGKAKFDYDSCWGCSICSINCPYKILKPQVAYFDTLLAEGAYAVLQKVKKAYFINFLMDITKLCDCCKDAGGIVLEDIGVIFGNNIVGVDKASFDLINKKAGKDLFKEIHKKSPLDHIKEAEMLGLGNANYKLFILDVPILPSDKIYKHAKNLNKLC